MPELPDHKLEELIQRLTALSERLDQDARTTAGTARTATPINARSAAPISTRTMRDTTGAGRTSRHVTAQTQTETFDTLSGMGRLGAILGLLLLIMWYKDRMDKWSKIEDERIARSAALQSSGQGYYGGTVDPGLDLRIKSGEAQKLLEIAATVDGFYSPPVENVINASAFVAKYGQTHNVSVSVVVNAYRRLIRRSYSSGEILSGQIPLSI